MKPQTTTSRRSPWIPLAVALFAILNESSMGQDALTYRGAQVPSEIESIYLKGLTWLVRNQTAEGCWGGNYGTEPGVVGVAVLAMLAHGDDPNFGTCSEPVRRSLDYILKKANEENGYIGSSMYNHGFATLALAEAYGTVNDPRLGPALKKAVDFILSCQARNSMGAWRYTPDSTDADTTVSGAQVVALLAAQNAGIAVPDKAIQTALAYFFKCQSGSGGFGYTGDNSHGSSTPSAIGTLVFALARQKSSIAFKSGVRNIQQMDASSGGHEFYHLYYLSQALFHGDMGKWEKWNLTNANGLALSQGNDGGWSASEGEAFATSAALLSLALNYRYLPIYER